MARRGFVVAVVALVGVAQVPAARAQLVNPSFENGLAGWTITTTANRDRTQVVVLQVGQQVALAAPVFDFDVGMMVPAISTYSGDASDGDFELAVHAINQLPTVQVWQEVVVPPGAAALVFEVGYMFASGVRVTVAATGPTSAASVACRPGVARGCGARTRSRWRRRSARPCG